MSRQSFTAPQKLRADHELLQFNCGEPTLDDWLRRRALQNEERGASRTYVVCTGLRVVGYYALAVGAVAHAGAPGRVRRNMPEPIPVMIIGRLAVDREFHGNGLGQGLLRDAYCAPFRQPILPVFGRSWSTPFRQKHSGSTRSMASCVTHRSHDVDDYDRGSGHRIREPQATSLVVN